jgi:hypothetical protein
VNDRERVLAVLEGRDPDRIPWIPRLDLWFKSAKANGALPPRFADLDLRAIHRRIGAGWPARDGTVYRTESAGETVRWRSGLDEITEIRTPVGSIRQVVHNSPSLAAHGIGGLVREHYLKGPRDYGVWSWLTEHRKVIPTDEEFADYDAQVGGDGLPMASMDGSPFYHFMEQLVGFEQAYYHLQDHAQEVENLLAVMDDWICGPLLSVVVRSPARLVLNGYHLGSDFTPPALYRRYVLPFYQKVNGELRRHGKFTAMHADTDTSAVLDLIEQSGWDMVECFLTAPMARVTLAEARRAWGDRMVIWGGLPSNLFSAAFSEEEFRGFLEQVFDIIAPGRAFVLGIADNAMPDSIIQRIEYVGQRAAARGNFPVRPRSEAAGQLVKTGEAPADGGA